MKVGFIGFGIMGWPQGVFLLRLGSAIGPNALHHPPPSADGELTPAPQLHARTDVRPLDRRDSLHGCLHGL